MNRRRVIINGVLVLALVGVGAGTYASLSSARSTPLTQGQVATVTRGPLTAAVSASGNVTVADTVAVDLDGVSGTVTKIYVRVGDRVGKGDKLLKVDATSARDDLASARADLRSAQAQLSTATQGRTPAQRAQDAASISSAQTSVDNARQSLSAARASYNLDAKQQRALVDLADRAVDNAEDDTYATASARDQAVRSAKDSLVRAQQARDSTLLKDRQSIDSAQGQVTSAQKSLTSSRATAAANSEPASAGDVASAQASVDKAEISVRQAENTVADATLKAPVAGTVAAVNAVKGQSSGSSSGGSTGGSSSSGSGGSGSSSTTSTVSSATSSGLVTLVDTTHRQVTASVAEADVVRVKVGQPAEVVFSASNKTAAGKVTAIDATSTVTNNVVEYGVTVSLASGAGNIRIGQTASITITTGTAKGVLSIPTSALTKTGDRYTVLRRSGTTESTVEVQTGLVGTTGTEITSGLAEGDTVVIATKTATTTNNGPPR